MVPVRFLNWPLAPGPGLFFLSWLLLNSDS